MQDWQKKFQQLERKLLKLEGTLLTKLSQTNESNTQEAPKILELETQILRQQKTINELKHELKMTQKVTNETKKENEFLNDKNRLFADKMFKFKSQGSKLISQVEDDMQKIREIVKHKL